MDIVVLGRIGYDLYSEEPQVPLPEVRRFSRYLGGSSANTAVGLARMGAKTGLVSCLGTDALSGFLFDFLRKENVDTAHIQTRGGFLPSLAISEVSPPDKFPQVFYRHDPVDTKLVVTRQDLDYIGSARMFVTNGTSLCASPSRESTYLALETAKQSGCRVVLDVDYRAMSWPSAVEAGLAVRLALPFVDVLIANEPELLLTAGCSDMDAAVYCGAGGSRRWFRNSENVAREFIAEMSPFSCRRTGSRSAPRSARATASRPDSFTLCSTIFPWKSACITATPQPPW